MKCLLWRAVTVMKHSKCILMLCIVVSLLNIAVVCEDVEGMHKLTGYQAHVRKQRNALNCNTHTCLYFGTPSQDSNGRCRCNCLTDYTGESCQTPPKALCRNDCQNNGIPYQKVEVGETASCVCKCPNGYQGNRCQTRRNVEYAPCDLQSHRCYNGGTPAHDSKGRCQCNCRRDYTGKRCQTPPSNTCRPIEECEHNGIPYLEEKNCICDCLYGFQGNRCQAVNSSAVRKATDCQLKNNKPIHECMCNENLICRPGSCCVCEPWLICENNSTTASIKMYDGKMNCVCDCLLCFQGTRCQARKSRKEICNPSEIKLPVKRRCSCPSIFTTQCQLNGKSPPEISKKLVNLVCGCLNNFIPPERDS